MKIKFNDYGVSRTVDLSEIMEEGHNCLGELEEQSRRIERAALLLINSIELLHSKGLITDEDVIELVSGFVYGYDFELVKEEQ